MRRDSPPAGQVGAGQAVGRTQQLLNRTLEHEVAAAGAGRGADLDDVVGGADHGLVVLHDDHGVAGGGEGADDADEPVDVARVQSDAGLIEDEDRVDQRGAEAGGEVDALHLAAAQRPRRSVERKVPEADLLEVAQARHEGIEGEVGGVGVGLGGVRSGF